MLTRIIFVSLLSILATTIFAQGKITLKTEKLSDFQPQSLYRTNNQVGYLFKVDDDEYQAVGYKGERLEEILKTNEAAYKEFRKFQRRIALGKVSYWVSGAALVSFPFLVQDDDTDVQAVTKVGIVSLLGIGSSITFAVIYRNAPRHLENAVAIYNQGLN